MSIWSRIVSLLYRCRHKWRVVGLVGRNGRGGYIVRCRCLKCDKITARDSHVRP